MGISVMFNYHEMSFPTFESVSQKLRFLDVDDKTHLFLETLFAQDVIIDQDLQVGDFTRALIL